MKRQTKKILLAAGILGLTAAPAAAAMVTNDLNLRQGPGTNYPVITSMPAGAQVDIDGCTGNWCAVDWRGFSGYASASFLADAGYVAPRAGYVAPRASYTYVAPRYAYNDYYYPGYRTYGYGPRLGFNLSIGDNDRWDRRRCRVVRLFD